MFMWILQIVEPRGIGKHHSTMARFKKGEFLKIGNLKQSTENHKSPFDSCLKNCYYIKKVFYKHSYVTFQNMYVVLGVVIAKTKNLTM